MLNRSWIVTVRETIARLSPSIVLSFISEDGARPGHARLPRPGDGRVLRPEAVPPPPRRRRRDTGRERRPVAGLRVRSTCWPSTRRCWRHQSKSRRGRSATDSEPRGPTSIRGTNSPTRRGRTRSSKGRTAAASPTRCSKNRSPCRWSSPAARPTTASGEPQSVRLVAAAKALSWERERQVERRLRGVPIYGVVREIELTTRRTGDYRRAPGPPNPSTARRRGRRTAPSANPASTRSPAGRERDRSRAS